MEKIQRRRIKCRILNFFYVAACAFAVVLYLTQPLIGLKVDVNISKEQAATLIETLVPSNSGSGDDNSQQTAHKLGVNIGGMDIDIAAALPEEGIKIEGLGFSVKGMDLINITLAQTPEAKYEIVNNNIVKANIESIKTVVTESLGGVINGLVTGVVASVVGEMAPEIVADIAKDFFPEGTEVADKIPTEKITETVTDFTTALTAENATVDTVCESLSENLTDILTTLKADPDFDTQAANIPDAISAQDLKDVLGPQLEQFGLVDDEGHILDVTEALPDLINMLLNGGGGDDSGDDQSGDPEVQDSARKLARVIKTQAADLEETADEEDALVTLIMGYIAPYVSQEFLSQYMPYLDYATYAIAGLVAAWALLALLFLLKTFSKKRPFVQTGLIYFLLGLVQFLIGLVFWIPSGLPYVIPVINSVPQAAALINGIKLGSFGLLDILSMVSLSIDSVFKWIVCIYLGMWVIGWFYNPARRKIKREMRRERRAA